MARQHATLTIAPPALVEALQLTLALTPRGEGSGRTARDGCLAAECPRRSPAAYHDQPVERQLGQVDRPAPAGRLHPARHCHGPQR